jgi:hypothetical protein
MPFLLAVFIRKPQKRQSCPLEALARNARPSQSWESDFIILVGKRVLMGAFGNQKNYQKICNKYYKPLDTVYQYDNIRFMLDDYQITGLLWRWQMMGNSEENGLATETGQARIVKLRQHLVSVG